MKKSIIILLTALLSFSAFAEENKVAVVISRTSYENKMADVSGASKSWTAICNLAGLPYSTLFVEDLDDEVVENHNVLVLCQCSFLTNQEYAKVTEFVSKIKDRKYGVIVDGPVGCFDQASDDRTNLPVYDMLGVRNIGFENMDGYRLKVADNSHYVTSAYTEGAYLSNLLTSSLPVLTLSEGSEVLVNVSNDVHSYPYETVNTKGNLKVAVINGLSDAACVGASFKNYAPKGFFPSEVYPVLRKTLQWCVTGDTCEPFPSLLLSDGGMTAFIRVDGDGSQAAASMDMCMNYLEDIALETGVQGVMTYVSSWATRAGWHFYVDHSKRLQELGTSIGTHSKNHRLAELKTDEQFSAELDGSKEEIRANHVSRGYDPGEIRFLVNPGNTLAMHNYNQVSSRFDFFMTHGQDQSLPVAYGNLTWFTDGKQLPMVNDSPSPDYQWFYDSSWSHTTAEVANYENLVLDHLFNTVGNGVIFDAMWHDYSMSKMLVGEPRNVTRIMKDGSRVINGSNQEYYETIRNFWNTHDVYCPEAPELAGKLVLLSNAKLNWTSGKDELTAEVSFRPEDFGKYAQYIGGMAIGVNNTDKAISSVEIDGKPYYAFSDTKVILPVPQSADMKITVRFGESKPGRRVIYSSKVLESVQAGDDALTAKVISKSMARVKFESAEPSIVLGASRFNSSRGGCEIEGRLLGSGEMKLVSNPSKVKIYSATLPVKNIKATSDGVKLTVCGNGRHHNSIVVFSEQLGRKTTIDIAQLKGEKTITIK